MHKSPLPLDSQNWIWKMHLHVLGTGKNYRPGKMSWLFCLKVWAEFMYEDTYSSFIICLYATNTTSHTTSSVFVSLFPVHLLAFEWRSEGSLKITSESEDTGAYTIKLLHVCGDVAFEKRWACMLKKDKVEDVGGAGEGQPSDKSTPAYRTPTKCLAPAWCGEGRCDLSVWGGWLNDFTSPFQLQQLPIYIVMQIHGLSQMVLFQHRGCIEIWLFIPSTSQVFNAPSSVCFYPFFLLAAV